MWGVVTRAQPEEQDAAGNPRAPPATSICQIRHAQHLLPCRTQKSIQYRECLIPRQMWPIRGTNNRWTKFRRVISLKVAVQIMHEPTSAGLIGGHMQEGVSLHRPSQLEFNHLIRKCNPPPNSGRIATRIIDGPNSAGPFLTKWPFLQNWPYK